MKYVQPEWFELKDLTIRSELERNPFRDLDVRRGDVVLDLGAYVGTFAVSALEAGSARVICFEPVAKSAAACRSNLAHYPAERWMLVERAVVPGRGHGQVHMEIASGFPSSSTLQLGRNAGKSKVLLVPAMGIRDVLVEHRPTVVKMDLELAEYAVLASLEPGDLAGVRAMHVEFHRQRQHVAEWRALRTYLRDEGLVEVNDDPLRSTWLRGPYGLLAHVI